jgi:CelD/BcsL family acetyltransferase involved in cellulose biosynthesis
MRDAPTNLEATYVGKVARLNIPLHSVVTLRRIAEELRGLATNLEYISRRDDTPPVALLEARYAVERAANRMKEIRGRGRPVKPPPPKFKHPNEY